jgi:hypothetical protein
MESEEKDTQIPRLPCDVIDIIDVEAHLTHVSNTIN